MVWEAEHALSFAGKAAKALYAAASTSAKETAAAVSASGRAAAEGVKRKAQRAKIALREAGEGLARAPAVRPSSMHPSNTAA